MLITDKNQESESNAVRESVRLDAASLKVNRQRCQLSQAKLASLTGIPRVYLSQFECGRYQLTAEEEERVRGAFTQVDKPTQTYAARPATDAAATDMPFDQIASYETRIRDALEQRIPRFLFFRDDEALQRILGEVAMLALAALDECVESAHKPRLTECQQDTVGHYVLSQLGALTLK
jgi:transcriptional regulator with XRE-family HTH domain